MKLVFVRAGWNAPCKLIISQLKTKNFLDKV